METFGQEIKEKAGFPNNKIITLRYDLIKAGLIREKEYDKIMNPLKMTKPK